MTNKQLMELLREKEELGLLELKQISPKNITVQNKHRVVKDAEDGTYYLISNVVPQNEASESLNVQMASDLKSLNKNVRTLTGIAVFALVLGLAALVACGIVFLVSKFMA